MIIIIISSFASMFVMYILCFFFKIRNRNIMELRYLVNSSENLVILKRYNEISKVNKILTVFGMILNISIWVGSIYVAFGFVAVWKVQRWEWLTCILIEFILDFVVFEFLFEFIIALIYLGRKKYPATRNVATILCKIRNYRGLAP